jgi:hypothetical protein
MPSLYSEQGVQGGHYAHFKAWSAHMTRVTGAPHSRIKQGACGVKQASMDSFSIRVPQHHTARAAPRLWFDKDAAIRSPDFDRSSLNTYSGGMKPLDPESRRSPMRGQ